MRQLRSRWAVPALVASAVLSFALSAEAQCPMPDNLDGGPCCTVTTANLPVFPAFNQGSMEICWRDCTVNATIPYDACWDAPTPAATTAGPLCSVYLSRVKLKVGGVIHWNSGPMRLFYSRTWFEFDGVSQRLQVWRFLVNGDLRATAAAGAAPCPKPICAASFGNLVHVTGYIDFAQDCLTGAWKNAWMLNHDCDRLQHALGFPRGGAFHKDRTYTWLGPAASFVISPVGPVEAGAATLESVRRLDLPGGGLAGACYFEERLIQGQMTHLADLCLCRPTGPNAQYAQGRLDLSGACGTTVTNAGGAFPKSFISKMIGRWTDPATYPGLEGLRWNVGGYTYSDACTLTSRQEFFYGVTTIGGYNAQALTSTGFGPFLDLTFIDQGNSLRNAAGALQMNVAYLSDHIINLNLP